MFNEGWLRTSAAFRLLAGAMNLTVLDRLVEVRMSRIQSFGMLILGMIPVPVVALPTLVFKSDLVAKVCVGLMFIGWALVPVFGLFWRVPRLQVTLGSIEIRSFFTTHRYPSDGTSFSWEHGGLFVRNGGTLSQILAVDATKFVEPLSNKQEAVSAAIEQMGYEVRRPVIQPFEPYNPPEVIVRDEGVQPDLLMVDPGDAVTWTWAEVSVHSITSVSHEFDSGVQSSGSFSHRFTTAGTFRYRCAVPGCDLAGEFVVREPAPPIGSSPLTL